MTAPVFLLNHPQRPSAMTDSQATTPEPSYNFFSDYSVILDYPLATVLDVISCGENMEPVARLGELTSEFKLNERDTVSLSTPLSTARLRTAPAASQDATVSSPGVPVERILPRQHFFLEETVHMFFGLFKQVVHLHGTQTWDDDARLSLYESQANSSGGIIEVWKLRAFEEVEEGGTKKTRVAETLKGRCPALVRLMVQSEINKAHPYVTAAALLIVSILMGGLNSAHMEKYKTLF